MGAVMAKGKRGEWSCSSFGLKLANESLTIAIILYLERYWGVAK